MNEQTISYERITVNYNKKPCYDIVFSKSFEALTTELSAFELENKKVCIITDSNVDTLFANEVFGLIKPLCKAIDKYVIPAGEENKTLDQITNIYPFIITRSGRWVLTSPLYVLMMVHSLYSSQSPVNHSFTLGWPKAQLANFSISFSCSSEVMTPSMRNLFSAVDRSSVVRR